ncbi:MAG: hypothetical protein HOE90_04955 [Bacteriovoracaceae bacterium]|jgi:hypothetical protein|nr:hypothetical protein [Bacteriovoracaceae bacterium]
MKVWPILFVLFCSCAHEVSVKVSKLEGDAIQPLVVLKNGMIHLSYFSGGNLYYKNQEEKGNWSSPLRINSDLGDVPRNGAISHHAMAVSGNGTVHISWIDMKKGKYLYTKKDADQKKFSENYSPLESYEGIEASPLLVVDAENHPHLYWHGGDLSDEGKRSVFHLSSKDQGKSFESKPVEVGARGKGACACCGAFAHIDGDGKTHILYRAATDSKNRDMTLINSKSLQNGFKVKKIHAWKLNACPVSTCHIGGGESTPLSWETEGEIFFALSGQLENVIKVPGKQLVRRKNPWISQFENHLLILWAEGNHWSSGGFLHWVLYDINTKKFGKFDTSTKKLPQYGRASSVAQSNGEFLIFR